MKIILPMAGNGSRFFDAGYSLPKPLIDVKGKPMFSRVLDNLNITKDDDIHFIVRMEHVLNYQIQNQIHDYYPDAHIHALSEMNEGACQTVLTAIDQYSELDFMVANCDQIMIWERPDFNFKIGGTIMTFTPDHDKPIHSYVKCNDEGHVIELAEKRMISNIATTGVYHFGSQKDFYIAAHQMMEANDRTNGEFYLAPVYNYLNKPIEIYHCEKFIGMGTPQELEELKQTDYYKNL